MKLHYVIQSLARGPYFQGPRNWSGKWPISFEEGLWFDYVSYCGEVHYAIIDTGKIATFQLTFHQKCSKNHQDFLSLYSRYAGMKQERIETAIAYVTYQTKRKSIYDVSLAGSCHRFCGGAWCRGQVHSDLVASKVRKLA